MRVCWSTRVGSACRADQRAAAGCDETLGYDIHSIAPAEGARECAAPDPGDDARDAGCGAAADGGDVRGRPGGAEPGDEADVRAGTRAIRARCARRSLVGEEVVASKTSSSSPGVQVPPPPVRSREAEGDTVTLKRRISARDLDVRLHRGRRPWHVCKGCPGTWEISSVRPSVGNTYARESERRSGTKKSERRIGARTWGNRSEGPCRAKSGAGVSGPSGGTMEETPTHIRFGDVTMRVALPRTWLMREGGARDRSRRGIHPRRPPEIRSGRRRWRRRGPGRSRAPLRRWRRWRRRGARRWGGSGRPW
jgi:hypothetical protein